MNPPGRAPAGSGAAVHVLALGDLHGSQSAAERIVTAAQAEGKLDVILLAGDLTRFFTLYQLTGIVGVFLRTGVPVLAVAGNCDGPDVQHELERLGCSIGGRGLAVAGLGFCGVPGAPRNHGHTWEVEESQLAAWLEQGYAELGGCATKVLLTHSPPAGIPDGMPGSTAIAQAVLRLDFDLVVCGHIHEARGITRAPAGRPLVVNCGCARDGHYAVIEISGRDVRADLR